MVEKALALLQEAGYGVLSEIDVQAKLKEKLDVERELYLILGSCNPPLANQGLKTSSQSSVPLAVQRRGRRARGAHLRRRGRA